MHNCGGKVIKVFLNKQRKKNSMGQLVLRGARDSERRAPSRSINASACHPTVPQITSVRSVAYLFPVPRSDFFPYPVLPLPTSSRHTVSLARIEPTMAFRKFPYFGLAGHQVGLVIYNTQQWNGVSRSYLRLALHPSLTYFNYLQLFACYSGTNRLEYCVISAYYFE